MTDETTEPITELPDGLVETLHDLDDDQLRSVMAYTHHLLVERDGHALADEIAAGPGEELVRVTEREGYVEVVKREPCGEGCPDCPHGPYLYHVYAESHPDGSERLRWVLLGQVDEKAASEGE
ncbi:MAG: hypothetical protein ABEJ78_09175 [Haloferacaceae archaeon]